MERKIGEIFYHKGEWYQCVEGGTCSECSFRHIDCSISNIGECTDKRTDGVTVIFKNLEKIGEPHWIGKRLMQPYELFTKAVTPLGLDCFSIWHQDLTIEIEIKQNQEYMEEKKIKLNQEDIDYIRRKFKDITQDYIIQGCDKEKAQYEFGKLFEPLQDSDNENLHKNLKPFSLEAAKQGKPVCTRDGRKARIICFDRVSEDGKSKIIACVISTKRECEDVLIYDSFGCFVDSMNPRDEDLMMLTEKHEGWINICKNADDDYFVKGIFRSEKFARNNEANYPGLIVDTTKIEWEE